MWQEARKQEKKLRGILIDYKKRAERRQAFYSKMRMDPHQLIRIHGQKCKFHMLGESSSVNNTDGQLMPWQGDEDILIDRFDVRAHLDFIPEKKVETKESDPEDEKFERKCNYERYRTLVQIDATGASEESYLKQLEAEEAFGRKQAEQAQLEKQKSASKAKAKIHYKYDDSTAVSDDDDRDDTDEESDGELSDIDINVNVLELTQEQTNHLDALATRYGVGYGQYCKQLLLEKKEFEYVKLLEAEEEERSKMPGRKGKSARRCLRIKQKTMRGSPLSFAVQEDTSAQDNDRESDSSSSSRSNSPIVEEKIEFITEFGGDIVKDEKIPKVKSHPRKKDDSHRNRSSHRSRSRSRSRNKNSRHRRSRSRDRHRHRSRSRSRSGNKHKSRSRSGDRRRHSKRSRSRSRHRSHRYSRSRSRDRSERHSNSRHRSHRSRSSSSSSRERSNSNKNSKSSTRKDRSRKDSRSRSQSTETREERYKRSKSPEKSKIDSKRQSRTKSRSQSRSKERRSRSRSKERRSRSRSKERRSRSRSKESRSKERRSRSRSKGKRSRSLSRESRSRSKSPHRAIMKRLGTNKATPVDKNKLTPREKMKLRMQKMLNKQIKVDKREEQKKQIAKDQEMEERDIQIYEMSRMMRMRDHDNRRRSPSPKGHLPSYDAAKFRYKSRSRSPS
ncbi:CLK4-associating serine/arginine rich protein-like [Hydractinia symbiolongicarpus]|uniref:CLK4-associating serine/arginine rich protein-like n=1 Tax=Hydractinia symbiolongicarpus TaxID=13093 RepID=UPI00254D3884|nr:CLK4-associating serine/arginine rich protein-like [Hydractinia symbiolongicarpus]